MTEQSHIGAEDSPELEAERSERLSRQDWLDLALRTLVDDGIDRVKVQIMAKQLGVARSSFYWHFESREDLHKAMLDDWLRKNTSPIIERAMRPEPDVNRALISVFECWIDEALFDPALDIAVRLWGRRSPAVRAVVVEADTLRVDALRRMFLRYGYREQEALIRARVIYFTQIGQYTLDVLEEPEVRFSHGPTYIHIFTGVAPDARQCQELADRVDEKVFKLPKRSKV
ncbi:TetR/AcrR family transcriptional regulator [Tabrizicola oligotrophica]|uniref:TetR/AcrR family transcriptional regulator n=1 Tax=Tabrizicola oligotrophica TaxID=2710650 RepID=A0A6M0QSV2_9RHOB|nr:TetR/AcrR family transcriptional regulator [Tabrizicola oligotrophica]NEY90091.1 TetR/AcrR family transcriptional regulator [Tabrizicola oligotrophica]